MRMLKMLVVVSVLALGNWLAVPRVEASPKVLQAPVTTLTPLPRSADCCLPPCPPICPSGLPPIVRLLWELHSRPLL